MSVLVVLHSMQFGYSPVFGPPCMCVSGVIIGCKLSTMSPTVSRSRPISSSHYAVSTMNTVCGLTSAIVAGITQLGSVVK